MPLHRNKHIWTRAESDWLVDHGALDKDTNCNVLAEAFDHAFPGRTLRAITGRIWFLRREQRLTAARASCDTVHHVREHDGGRMNRQVIEQALQVCLTLADLKSDQELEIPVGAFESELAACREVRDAMLRDAIAGMLVGHPEACAEVHP